VKTAFQSNLELLLGHHQPWRGEYSLKREPERLNNKEKDWQPVPCFLNRRHPRRFQPSDSVVQCNANLRVFSAVTVWVQCFWCIYSCIGSEVRFLAAAHRLHLATGSSSGDVSRDTAVLGARKPLNPANTRVTDTRTNTLARSLHTLTHCETLQIV